MLKKVFNSEYILASKSPRRKKLLKQLGLNFKSSHSNIQEIENDNNPFRSVKENSKRKANYVSQKFINKIIIGADTVVVINKKVIHKPKNLSEAKRFLQELSGRKHIVYTGVYIINQTSKKEIFGLEKTIVEFRKIPESEIHYYVNNHKPLDKAGAYGIQDDFGCLFVKRIIGDYYNVVGLPLVKMYSLIQNTF